MHKAIFLDRDGILNNAIIIDGKLYPPQAIEDVIISDGIVEKLYQLKTKGFLLIGVTNQPDVVRGDTPQQVVESINSYIKSELSLDALYVCYHDDKDNCLCRKPEPGLILSALKKYQISAKLSYMVGDRWKDVEAGKRAGCKTIWVNNFYSEKYKSSEPDYVSTNQADAFQWIIQRSLVMIKRIEDLTVKIFADGADKNGMLEMYNQPYIKGLTTNPTLMRKAGINNYTAFAQEILTIIKDRPISFEVFSDDFDEMEQQALEIASWGGNVYVKIPVTNTNTEPSYTLVSRLTSQKVKVNVTAIMTLEQVRNVIDVLAPDVPSYVSVFAGRIADTGYDPLPIMTASLEIMKMNTLAELIWASPRELLNIFQADAIGCHVITVTNDILKKLPLVGYNLRKYSLDTVKMFYNDAEAAGFKLPISTMNKTKEEKVLT